MGSFNTTCGVSNTSIREGDKVRLFFLLSKSFNYKFDPKRDSINKGSQYYPWDDFTVIGGVSIPATYADYGYYNFDEKSLEALYIHNIITKNYVENIPKEGSDDNYSDDYMNIKVNDLSWKTIQGMIHNGCLYMNNDMYYNKESNQPFVSIFAVHEKVYQVMIGSKENIEKELNEGFDIDEYTEILNKHIESLKGKVEDGELTENQAKEKAEKITDFIFEHKIKEKQNRFFNLQPVAYKEDPISGIELLVKKLTLKEIKNKDIRRSVLETDKFLICMYCYNLMLRPVRTSGQDGDLESEVNFMRRIASAVENIPEKWDDTLSTNKFSLNWQEVNFSDIQKRIKEYYKHLNDEEYLYFAKMIEGKDKIIIEPEDWEKNKYYEYLGDLFSNKVLPLHILNK